MFKRYLVNVRYFAADHEATTGSFSSMIEDTRTDSVDEVLEVAARYEQAFFDGTLPCVRVQVFDRITSTRILHGLYGELSDPRIARKPAPCYI